MRISDGLISMDQFGTGLEFRFPRVIEEERWQQWYDGQYQTLMPAPTIDNGYKLFAVADLIKLPLHKLASDFYVDATLGEDFTVTTLEPSVQEWLDENLHRFLKIIRRGVEGWSITGRAVYVTHEDGALMEVPSYRYFRIGREYDPDHVIAHVIAWPYYEYREGERFLPFSNRVPNRIRITKYAPSETPPVNEVAVYELHGNVVGQLLQGPEPAGITSLCTAGDGDSWYGDAQTMLARMMIRVTNHDRTLNLSDNRPMMVPAQLMTTTPGQTRQARREAFYNEINPIIETDAETARGNYGTLGVDYQHSESRDFIELLADSIYLVSGIPPATFGIGIGRNESGAAREKAQDRASAKIRTFRNDLRQCIPILLRGLKAPDGDLQIAWLTAPFQTRQDKINEAIRLMQTGLITKATAQRMLGLAEEDTADAPQTDENQEQEE